MVGDLYRSWQLLHVIIERHETSIRKRWGKKTRQKRLDVLLGAWPGMSPAPRPDFRAYRQETHEQRESGTHFRESYIWTYINQEDLVRPGTLPLFLNLRARNLPNVFASGDLNAANLGPVADVIKLQSTGDYNMRLSGDNFPRHYGKLVAWESEELAFVDLAKGKVVHPSGGFWSWRSNNVYTASLSTVARAYFTTSRSRISLAIHTPI